MKKTSKVIKRFKKWFDNILGKKNVLYIGLVMGFVGLVYLMGKCADHQVRTFHKSRRIDFSEGKIFGDKGRSIYKRKEQVFAKKFEHVEKQLIALDKKLEGFEDSLKIFNELGQAANKTKRAASQKPDFLRHTLGTRTNQVGKSVDQLISSENSSRNSSNSTNFPSAGAHPSFRGAQIQGRHSKVGGDAPSSTEENLTTQTLMGAQGVNNPQKDGIGSFSGGDVLADN